MTGRLNLPFLGVPTFGKRPYVEDRSRIEADATVRNGGRHENGGR
ncbi:hypothetical protein [Paracoccus sp. S-4012]